MFGTIEQDLKVAMLARDSVRVDVLKSLKSALIYEKIAQGSDLDDQTIQAVVRREAKKRQEAITIYEQAGRADHRQKEQQELAILQSYLPTQLSEAELMVVVEKAIDELNVSNSSEVGKVMGHLTKKLQGRADNKLLSQIVQDRLKS